MGGAGHPRGRVTGPVVQLTDAATVASELDGFTRLGRGVDGLEDLGDDQSLLGLDDQLALALDGTVEGLGLGRSTVQGVVC